MFPCAMLFKHRQKKNHILYQSKSQYMEYIYHIIIQQSHILEVTLLRPNLINFPQKHITKWLLMLNPKSFPLEPFILFWEMALRRYPWIAIRLFYSRRPSYTDTAKFLTNPNIVKVKSIHHLWPKLPESTWSWRQELSVLCSWLVLLCSMAEAQQQFPELITEASVWKCSGSVAWFI